MPWIAPLARTMSVHAKRTAARAVSVDAPVRRGWRGLGPHGEVAVSLLALGLVWHLASLLVANEVILPPPGDVLAAWWRLLLTELPSDVLASLRHLAVGYSAGASTGLSLALLVVRWRPLETLVDPLVELLRPISAIAWIPIAIMMFGISDGVAYFLISYTAVFPIFLNTVAGIRAVDRKLLQVAATLGASPGLIARRVILPAALPMILAGARLSLGVAWMTLIAAELVGTDSGLGWRSFWYQEMFSMSKTMAVILTIGVLGYGLDAAVRALQGRLTRWRPATPLVG